MKKFKKSIAVALSLSMLLSSAGAVSAAVAESPAVAANTVVSGNSAVSANSTSAELSLKPTKIDVYVSPDIAVTLNGEYLQFSDEKGGIVYPIIYKGSTYLPVRAIATLMGEPVEWINSAKMVMIGKTLSEPDNKKSNKNSIDTNSSFVTTVDYRIAWPQYIGEAYLKPDVTIMYYFEAQTFKNVVGDTVYPIIYNGSTYLPLRSIAELVGIDIGWENSTRTVFMEYEEEPEPVAVRTETQSIKNTFDDVEDTYTNSTTDLMQLQATTQEKLPELAAKISAYYARAHESNKEVEKMLESADFTEDEDAACRKLAQFASDCETYVLVLENIVYMALQEQDYSVLSEVFFESAVTTQESMEEAREAIECL